MALASPLIEIHRKAGAKLAEYCGVELPKAFADFAQEYEAARKAVALLDTNVHAFAALTRPDRVRFLNAIATNDIKILADGQGSVGLLLNPQGHILAEMECYALGDRLLVVLPALAREQAIAWLEKYIIMDDVTLEDVTGSTASVAVEGPRAAELLNEVCGLKLEAMPERGHREVMIGAVACRAIRRSHFGEIGAEFLVERDAAMVLWQTLAGAVSRFSGRPIGYGAMNALRLEAGIPWFGYDFDEKQIPHEAALEYTHISYTKGCYTGQEIVERVRSRGHVNRRRVRLEFGDATVPAAGASLLVNSQEVGNVTSAAFSPSRGHAIGMGYLRREYTAPGSQVQYDGGTATVMELTPRAA